MSHPPVAKKRWIFNRVLGLCLVVTCGVGMWQDCLRALGEDSCFGLSAARYIQSLGCGQIDVPYSAYRDEYAEYFRDQPAARRYWDSLVVSGTVLQVVLWLSLLGTAVVVVARPRFSLAVMVAASAASIGSMQVFLYLTTESPLVVLSGQPTLLSVLAVVVWSGICLVPAIAWLVRFLNRIEANKLARRR